MATLLWLLAIRDWSDVKQRDREQIQTDASSSFLRRSYDGVICVAEIKLEVQLDVRKGVDFLEAARTLAYKHHAYDIVDIAVMHVQDTDKDRSQRTGHTIFLSAISAMLMRLGQQRGNREDHERML